jgi:hypothetical protein
MQLFKTEMMFMHPPRTRPVYGWRSKRVLRYGRGLPVWPDLDALTSVRSMETPAAVQHAEASSQVFDVDRAA